MSAPLLESVQILRLKPGDVIVAETDLRLDPQRAQLVSESLRERFPGHEVIVTCGVRLRIQRPEAA